MLLFDAPDQSASTPQPQRLVLESRLRYHHRCLHEDATNPELTSMERLTLVRDRVARIREITRELEARKGMGADYCAAQSQAGVVNGRRNLLDEAHCNR